MQLPLPSWNQSVDNSNGQAGALQRPSFSRRSFLMASASMALLAACRRSDSSAAATQPTFNAAPHRYSAEQDAFLQLSAALVGKQDLDPQVSSRIFDALAQQQPAAVAALPELTRLAKTHGSPQAILAASTGPARDAMLAITAAWYTGTVGKGTAAVTAAYRDALMQRPVADGLFPQTYALGGPGWWVATPPPAVIAA